GLAAGLGLALKPHQALLPIAVELYLIVRTRSLRSLLRPEPLCILAVAAGYIAAIHKLTPEYFTTVLPILRDTYWAVGSLSLPELVWQAIQLHILAAVAIFFYIKRHRNHTGPWALDPVPCLLIGGAASTFAYYLQGTGWYYQQLPALSFFAIASWIELLPIVRTQGIRFSLRVPLAWPAGGLAILAIALTAYFSGYSLSRPWEFPSGLARAPDPAFFTNLAPRTPVAILTTEVD